MYVVCKYRDCYNFPSLTKFEFYIQFIAIISPQNTCPVGDELFHVDR